MYSRLLLNCLHSTYVNGARMLLAYLQKRDWGQKSAEGWQRRRNANGHKKRRMSAEGRQRFEPII